MFIAQPGLSFDSQCLVADIIVGPQSDLQVKVHCPLWQGRHGDRSETPATYRAPQSQNSDEWQFLAHFFLFVFNKAVIMIIVKLQKSFTRVIQNTLRTFNCCT